MHSLQVGMTGPGLGHHQEQEPLLPAADGKQSAEGSTML